MRALWRSVGEAGWGAAGAQCVEGGHGGGAKGAVRVIGNSRATPSGSGDGGCGCQEWIFVQGFEKVGGLNP